MTSVILWSILDAFSGIFGFSLYSDFTQIVLTLMIQPAFGNFIPIAILMYTHLSNVTSIQQMLKPRPGSEATTVNQSGYMFDEVGPASPFTSVAICDIAIALIAMTVAYLGLLK